MRRHWIKMILAVSVMGLVTGCMEPPKPAELVAKASDSYMTKKLTKYINSDYYNKDTIVHHIYISGDKGHVDGSLREVHGEYEAQYFALSEPMTKAYIKAAKARGNIVKLYKKQVSKVLGENTPKVFSRYDGDRAFFDWDPALIEFDKEGNIVSIMIQKHKVSYMSKPVPAYLHDRYSAVFTGKAASRLIYSIGNNVLDNGYIRTL